ncbi:MAG: phosphate acetyltransferase [Candidatus Aminicenantes bacterium]|nr:phosphate acetyltransferase [Candidatus Aminicenantes bacterium]
MAENLYVTATEPRSGKSVISLGLMEMLLRNVDRVAFFRPLINGSHSPSKKEHDIRLISQYYKLDIPYEAMYGYKTTEASQLISSGKYEMLLEGIVSKYKALEENFDFVLVEGTDFEGSTSAFEFDINADIANNLGCPVILVAKAYRKTEENVTQSINMTMESLSEKGCNVIAIFINRMEADSNLISKLKKSPSMADYLIYGLPNVDSLGHPTVKEIAEALQARVLYGKELLNRHVSRFGVAAMQLRHVLERVQNGDMIITPGDRADVIVASLAGNFSSSMPRISGLILSGGLIPEPPILRMIEGIKEGIPILSVKENTFEAAREADNVHAVLDPEDSMKMVQALEVFEKNTNIPELREKIIRTNVTILTPKMFEYRLLQKARAHKQHIVLPEGEEDRILQAADILLRRDVVDLTVLGNEQEIRNKITRLDLNLEKINIIDIGKSKFFDDFSETYYQLRKHKRITIENARDNMSDPNYFGSMMVYKGLADGMVSGAIHTTRSTLRPSFEFIKTKAGYSIISSVFFMCLADRVLVYADCAVNPEPNAQQLAEIAVNSAQTALIFSIEPIVAMLSYSTGESGEGEDVEKVRKATAIAQEIVKKNKLGFPIEGPLQYDAATDPTVARTKMPKSEVAGKATVYIFPDLNTGNNTYKAVQRSANAVAIGPVIQGLNKPVNDLSRGATVADIVNTVAITAIQAQAEKDLLKPGK